MPTTTRVSELLRPENVLLDLVAPTKPHLLRILSHRASDALGVGRERIFNALTVVEGLGSTGIGEGVAIPHSPIAEVLAPFGMLARLANALDFRAIDAEPVDIVFLIITPADGRMAHLDALACVARRLRSSDVRRMIRSATGHDALYAAVAA